MPPHRRGIGMVVQQYLEEHEAPGGVLVASGPPRGVIGITMKVARRQPLTFLRMNATWSLLPLVDDPQVFRVVVADEAPNDDSADDLALEDLTESADLDDVVPPGVGLAVISGLVDDVSVEQGGVNGLAEVREDRLRERLRLLDVGVDALVGLP